MCDHSMWVTMGLLVGRDCKRTEQDLLESVKEWVDRVLSNINEPVCESPSPEPTEVSSHFKTSSPNFTKAETKSLLVRTRRARLRSKLEHLMGSDAILINDRAYMQRLQQRIREEHEENVRKRIREREVGEVEREKRLVLEGKIPVEEAPEELANHPVFKITQLTKKILEEKKIQAENYKALKPLHGYHYNVLRSLTPEIIKHTRDNAEAEIVLDDEEIAKIEHLREIEMEIESGNLFTEEDCEQYKYENPLVRQLRKVEDVDDMYKIAELIVGPMKSIRC